MDYEDYLERFPEAQREEIRQSLQGVPDNVKLQVIKATPVDYDQYTEEEWESLTPLEKWGDPSTYKAGRAAERRRRRDILEDIYPRGKDRRKAKQKMRKNLRGGPASHDRDRARGVVANMLDPLKLTHDLDWKGRDKSDRALAAIEALADEDLLMDVEGGGRAGITEPTEYDEAHMRALRQLQEIADAGGYTGVEREQIEQAAQQAAMHERAQRQAALQQMASRGVAGGGAELGARLAAQQQSANLGRGYAADIAAQGQRRALAAMRAAGQQSIAGGNLAQRRQEALDRLRQSNLDWQRQIAMMKAGHQYQQRMQPGPVENLIGTGVDAYLGYLGVGGLGLSEDDSQQQTQAVFGQQPQTLSEAQGGQSSLANRATDVSQGLWTY